ncbi:MAG: hypothetical protein IT532_02370 [Burkholderiales bacterium]|nr:hypothetical protein [Burkholderiales bacterium]
MNEQASEQQLNGMAEYVAAVDDLLQRPVRTLRIFERQLDRAFGGARRCETLRAFLLADRGNRLRIVVHETDNLGRDCARLLALQRQFPHAIAIHETHTEARRASDPFAVADERHHVHRFHHDQARGVLRLHDPALTRPFIDRFEEIWSFSTPSVNATTLGL